MHARRKGSMEHGGPRTGLDTGPHLHWPVHLSFPGHRSLAGSPSAGSQPPWQAVPAIPFLAVRRLYSRAPPIQAAAPNPEVGGRPPDMTLMYPTPAETSECLSVSETLHLEEESWVVQYLYS